MHLVAHPVGIYPFQGMKLGRADVEWLLATHENGRGPVDWSDPNQRGREGLQLSGTDLRGIDLSGLPLACLQGEVKSEAERKSLFRVLEGMNLERASLTHAHLENANLIGANLKKAYFFDAYLEEAKLFWAQLVGQLASGLRTRIAAPEPARRRSLARSRRRLRLPFHTKGVGFWFQPATVCSNQSMIS
jgi:hypothetical protein